MFIIRFLLTALLFSVCGSAELRAQTPASPSETSKVTELLRLLDDQEVKAWLEQKQAVAPGTGNQQAAHFIEQWEAHARTRVNALLAAVPNIDDELSRAASTVLQETRGNSLAPIALMLGVIASIAFGTAWACRRFVPVTSSPNLLLQQIYTELLSISVFTVTVIILFLLFDWPPLMRVVVLYALVALIVYKLATAFCRLVLSASIISDRSYSRIRLLVALAAAMTAFLAICERLGVTDDVRSLLAIGWSIPLLAIAIEMIWRARADDAPSVQGRPYRMAGISAAILLWLIWCTGFLALFWLGIVLVIVPRVLSIADRLASALSPSRVSGDGPPEPKTVLFVRGIRAAIIIAAVSWVELVWRHNFESFSTQMPLVQTIVAGVFNSVVILLFIDLTWQLANAYITRKLSDFEQERALASNETVRQGRLRTLLPVFRNALAVALLCLAALMVLSQMGVKIGPLIAGAGVVGVAIGFGSQTLVKDIVSGIFYLLDDAFRIGEYIEAGNYNGVVESFSLRSIRLRHSRGAIYTVPFGSLGAIKNSSRDWAVDKFHIRVPFKTDLDKVRKLVKNIGGELQTDPELGSFIIQPLKLKGVEQIGEYGIELGVAFTCKPGEQTTIRRRAYTMLMQAFQDNGIDFAQPIVQVSGNDKDAAAAAIAQRRRLEANGLPPEK